MKYLLVITIMVLGISSLSAQEKGKVRVGLDLGYVFAKDGGGILFNLEPKYNLTDNSNIGLRLGTAASASSSDVDANLSVLGTYDHYFNKGTSSVAPFLGGGLGAFIFGELEGKSGSIDAQFGGMIRGGAEFGKFRVVLEYNIIPKSDIGMGQSIDNSYFGMSIGFYVGGGKWKK